MLLPSPPVRPDPDHAPTERERREDPAAAYRPPALFGTTDLVFTHRSARLPGPGAGTAMAADDDLSERERLARNLGGMPCMVPRHRSVLTVGRTVAEAFDWMHYLEQSCRIQLAAQGAGAPFALPSREAVRRTRARFGDAPGQGSPPWRALRRKLDREQPDGRA